MEKMFSSNKNVESLNLTSFDIENCQNFEKMFDGCSALKKLILDENKKDQYWQFENYIPIWTNTSYE